MQIKLKNLEVQNSAQQNQQIQRQVSRQLQGKRHTSSKNKMSEIIMQLRNQNMIEEPRTTIQPGDEV